MGYADDEFRVNLDTGDDAPDTITGMLRGAASQLVPQGSSLSLLMKPEEIASVPGLPDDVYGGNGALGNYADQRVRQDVDGQQGTGSNPGGYAPTFDPVSLAPREWNPSGLNISANSPEPGEKAEQASKSASILGHLTDFWDLENHLVGAVLGQDGAEMLGKFATKPVAAIAIPAEHIFKAHADISKGAQPTLTWMGAGAKTATAFGGMGLGAMAGAMGGPAAPITIPLGAAIGAFAPQALYRNTSNEQFSRAMDRAL